MQFPDAQILLFTKAPEVGKVKTRLIPALTPIEAAKLYRELVVDTIQCLAEADLAPITCLCAPNTDHPFFQQLTQRYEISLQAQRGGDLGERMAGASQDFLTRQTGPVLLVGGDCPVLRPVHLQQAFDWLACGDDAVIGPAEDGGYVLLGINRMEHSLFRDIAWGSDQVLKETRLRMARLNWRWRELETLWDLDRPQDLQRYQQLMTVLRQK